jgi:hypothetical protein
VSAFSQSPASQNSAVRKRIDEATLEKLEAQYADFCEFASKRLSRSGRVHQTEISRAFRNAYPQYASEDVLEERDLRSLIANFAPAAERSPRGYYKNLSLVQPRRRPRLAASHPSKISGCNLSHVAFAFRPTRGDAFHRGDDE